MVQIDGAGIRMPASRTDPFHPWVRWTADSMQRSLGRAVQIIPNASGGLPGDVFADHLGRAAGLGSRIAIAVVDSTGRTSTC